MNWLTNFFTKLFIITLSLFGHNDNFKLSNLTNKIKLNETFLTEITTYDKKSDDTYYKILSNISFKLTDNNTISGSYGDKHFIQLVKSDSNNLGKFINLDDGKFINNINNTECIILRGTESATIKLYTYDLSKDEFKYIDKKITFNYDYNIESLSFIDKLKYYWNIMLNRKYLNIKIE